MNFFTAASYIISHIFLTLFLYLFIIHRYSRAVTGMICFFLFLSLSALDIVKLIFFPDSDLCYVVVTIFQILLTQATPFFISGKKSSQILFIGLSASSYVITGAIFAAVLKIYTGSTLFALSGSFAIHLAILLFLCVSIREMCLKVQREDSRKNFWELCLIPVFFYCSFSFIAFFPNTLFDDPDNIPGTLFAVITMFISYIVVLRYLQSESRKNAAYWKNMIQESYIQGLENRHYLVERAEQNLKILHHDIRHYSKIIDSLLEQKKYDEIKEVNTHISLIAEENKVEQHCANLIVNTILEDKKRYIEMKIHCMKDHLFIQTKNEYEEDILLDPETGLPKSKKSGNHGLGMQSILAFAEKTGGTVGCYLDDGFFRIMMSAKF